MNCSCNDSTLGRGQQMWHTLNQLFMVAKHSVARGHIGSGIFAWRSVWHAIAKCMKRHQPVYSFQKVLIQRMLRVLHHILISIEMVEHLKSLEQGFSCRNHPQALLFQFSRIVYRKRVALNGTRMGREKYFVVFQILFFIHFLHYHRLIFLSQTFVFFYFCFKCHWSVVIFI